MQLSSRSRRALAASATVLALAACADDPVQPSKNSLRPPSHASFALATDAPATDLGTLGGPDSRATAINDSGHVVGMARDTSGFLRAFIWKPTTGMRLINVNPGPVYTLAIDINEKGQVVGYVDSLIYARSFVWSATGGVKWLPTLGGRSTYAYAINNHGDVVGSSETASGTSRAFLWTAADGRMRDLGTLGSACSFSRSYASDINDSREVVGQSCADTSRMRAFVWSDSAGMRDLGTLGGFTSNAYAINNSSQVVGVAQTDQGVSHAVLWSAAGMRDLGTFGGDSSIARGINDAGEVVGESLVVGNAMYHGFLWTESGGMQKLLGLAGSGAAYSINSSGQVAGWSRDASDRDRATAWGVGATPPPPPPNQAPIVAAGGPYSGVEGSPIAFSGSATDPDGDSLVVSWAFGDGDSASTANASHAYANNGSLAARFAATDSKGATSSTTANVTIANVAPRVTTGAGGSIYSGDTYALNASFSDPGTLDSPWRTSITWGDGARTSDSTSNQSAPITGTHRYFQAGTYTVYVTATDKDHATGADSVTVQVLRLPTPIDVDPKSTTNSISMRSGGQQLSVALLSTATYDARLTVASSIVITNGSGSGTRLRDPRLGRDYSHADVDKDGRIDMLLTFYKPDLIASGDLTTATTSLIVLADHADSRQTRGENAVTVRP